MRRKMLEQLIAWKQNGAGKTALLIDGARRVGKSYCVEQFARQEYRSYILIDFNRASNDVCDLFVHYLNDLDTLFMYLSNYYNVKLYHRESLIIFDEVGGKLIDIADALLGIVVLRLKEGNIIGFL